MSEGLIGVLIGGILSGLGTWITLAIQQRRWRTELRIAHLKSKRERLEATCERVLRQLQGGMTEDEYPSNMISDIDFLLPEGVSKVFEEMMAEKDLSDSKKRGYYYGITREMKKCMKAIDAEIENVALGHKA